VAPSVGSERQRPPAVERIRAAMPRSVLADREPRAVVDAIRRVVAEERERLHREPADHSTPRSAEALAEVAAIELERTADAWLGGQLGAERNGAAVVAAINASGVLIHTNLGRSTWPAAAIEAASVAARAPLLLELDAETGRRGRRYRAAEELLVALTGAEDALVTNNNAAAVSLAVGLAGRGRRVLVSRGELVEIGGGVRIPEIVKRAGARLVEVGTTNRTRASDFEAALADGPARVVLRVHRSNFRQEGFVEDPDAAAVAEIAHRHGAIVVDDLGSGALIDTAQFGLPHEPTPRERLEAAASDLVTFSGDKLVGGPQAGLVVGRPDLIERIRRDPLARAMRPDKVTLAAVAATLAIYRAGRAAAEIPLWQAVARPLADLQARASAVAARLGGTAIPTEATFGGGALPGVTLPSAGVALAGTTPDRQSRALRLGVPPVIGRIEGGRLVLDLRTVEPERDDELVEAVRAAR
jgi:L-seryl-tRNA(Ser) seleniumtransferase